MSKKYTKQQVEGAKEELRKKLKPGDRVFTTVTHVSRSGMMRRMRLFTIKDNNREEITHWVARALEWSINDDHELRVDGVGMDMGFHAVYSLSRVLFPDGFECVGEGKEGEHWTKGCPANDHFNGDRNYKPHKHNDGGYALRQEWL